jgi:cell division protein FtsQ
LSDHFTSKVLVANGAILEGFDGKVDTLQNLLSKDLFEMAKFINADSLWSEQIVQIYVNDHKDMELVPRVGNQKIIFGNADRMKEKFRNLLLFYKKALPKVGWDAYSSINLKFNGQIVCVKRDSTLKKQLPAVISVDSVKIKLKGIQDSIQNIL